MNSDKRFELLAHVVEIANSSVDVNERLDSILGSIVSHLAAKGAVLFLQEHSRSRLVKANIWPREMDVEPGLSLEFGLGLVGEVALKRAPQLKQVADADHDPAVDAFCKRDEQAALFPVMDDNRLYAVLLVIFPPGGGLTSDDIGLMQMVAREMAGSIRNFRLYFEAKKRIAELNVLSDLGRAAISTIEVEELLDTVAGNCAKLLGGRGGLVSVEASNGRELKLRAIYGQVPEGCREADHCVTHPRSGGGELECRVEGGPCQPDKSGMRQALCVPLAFKGNYQGHLCVFDKVVVQKEAARAGFNEEDHNLLTTMASMVSAALENALTFQRVEDLAERNEEMVGSLATLFEISTVLMTTVDFDETVQILLRAVIHPAGLDHDRVILFLVHDEEKSLRAVAEMAKGSVGGATKELTQTLMDLKTSQDKPSLISPELARVSLMLDDPKGATTRTVAEGKPILVEDPEAELGQAPPEFLKALGHNPFVALPMFAKGKVVGVMVVNNALSHHPFSDRQIKLLAMLANLGGLAVENARLYQNLENANRELAQMRSRLVESDRLAALGEIAAGVAHEIRNPLVSIGGFTRRIRKKIEEDSPIRPYLDVIIEEVTRLERTLNEMLDFSSETRDHYEEHDFNAIMDQALELLQRELEFHQVEVVRNYDRDLPQVFCDDRQIKHVFFNLYLNAVQAMGDKGGTLTVRSYSLVRDGKEFVAGEVNDTGGGIPMDVIHDIFNPFFTTKDSGSGLGLSIVHKIVTRHFGQVEVHNRGEGASFVVRLPAAEEGRAYLK